MLVSLKWLSQYVDISSIEANDLAEKITRAGIEVDAVIDRSQGMTNVVVGHVVSKEKHPEADKILPYKRGLFSYDGIYDNHHRC